MGTIYRNGKVNTIIKNGKIYGYASKSDIEILKGTTTPTLAQGNNGQIYLKYLNIPENDYTIIDHIKSTGGAYIDTLFTFNQDSSIYIDFTPLNLNEDKAIYGSRKSGSENDFELHFYYGNAVYAGYNKNTDIKSSWGIAKNNSRYKVYQNKNLFYLNDEIIYTFSSATFTTPYDMVLFAIRNNNSTPSWNISARLYGCKIWDDGILVRNFIPVIRNSDDEVGLYDTINGVFYTNANNSGSFSNEDAIILNSNYVTDTFVKVNNTWQNLIGSDINDVGNASETATPINMSNITRFQEGSMSSASAENVTSVIWNNGQLIGSTIYYTNSIDVTNINKLYYELQTGTCYGGSHQSRDDWKLMIALRSTAPNSILQGNYSSLGFSVGSEFNDANTNYGTQEIDVSELTGNYYLVVNSHGWNVNLSNLRYE